MGNRKVEEDSITTLLRKYSEGDLEARDKIFGRYKYFAKSIARSYLPICDEENDLIQSAYEGIMIAIEKSKNNFSRFYIIIKESIEKSVIDYIFSSKGINGQVFQKNGWKLYGRKTYRKILQALKDSSYPVDNIQAVEEIAATLNISTRYIILALIEMNLVGYMPTELSPIDAERSTEIEYIIDETSKEIYEAVLENHLTQINGINLTHLSKRRSKNQFTFFL